VACSHEKARGGDKKRDVQLTSSFLDHQRVSINRGVGPLAASRRRRPVKWGGEHCCVTGVGGRGVIQTRGARPGEMKMGIEGAPSEAENSKKRVPDGGSWWRRSDDAHRCAVGENFGTGKRRGYAPKLVKHGGLKMVNVKRRRPVIKAKKEKAGEPAFGQRESSLWAGRGGQTPR